MKLEITYFVVMDTNKSFFLVNQYGNLSKMPDQAMQFSTHEQAERAIQKVYPVWRADDELRLTTKAKDNMLMVFKMKRTHELLSNENK